MSSSDTSQGDDGSWIRWFCEIPGNECLCEVDRHFIEDSFNLFGLKAYLVEDYALALSIILGKSDNRSVNSNATKHAMYLYGLIHARYILTVAGLEAMCKKYLDRVFGVCPRTFCRGQNLLPTGISESPKIASMKLFCSRCNEIYNCNPNQRNLDGAFFGPTFAHLFYMTFEKFVPTPSLQPHGMTSTYVPRVYGFKVHSSSSSLSKNKLSDQHLDEENDAIKQTQALEESNSKNVYEVANTKAFCENTRIINGASAGGKGKSGYRSSSPENGNVSYKSRNVKMQVTRIGKDECTAGDGAAVGSGDVGGELALNSAHDRIDNSRVMSQLGTASYGNNMDLDFMGEVSLSSTIISQTQHMSSCSNLKKRDIVETSIPISASHDKNTSNLSTSSSLNMEKPYKDLTNNTHKRNRYSTVL